MAKNKFKVNDRVFSKSWRNYNPFYIVDIFDGNRIVIQNDKIRAITKAVDLSLIRENDK
jgi:hypothetical protein|eukprot:SAG31_NODE_8380_length_1463_cov_1.343842_2_plen_59_part_00